MSGLHCIGSEDTENHPCNPRESSATGVGVGVGVATAITGELGGSTVKSMNSDC
ncbi:hypothetical protein N9V84_05445 [Verrucomicrobiales bacterium]|nr:hypothetical protein [Verrucomicrobiales bacterium]